MSAKTVLIGLAAIVPSEWAGAQVAKPATIVASTRWTRLLTALNRAAAAQGVPTLTIRTYPTTVVALQALSVDQTSIAAIERAPWPSETRPFRQLHAYEPTAIRIGWISKSKAGFYVNAENPLRKLTFDQLSRIITTGALPNDIDHWSQLSANPAWAAHAIHLYARADDGRSFTTLRYKVMDARPLSPRFEMVGEEAAVVDTLSHDKFGIAYLDDPGSGANVRQLEIGPNFLSAGADKPNEPFATSLNLFFDQAPGKQVSPIITAYLRFVLSREGQAVIATQRSSSGFTPLSPEEAEEELQKIPLVASTS